MGSLSSWTWVTSLNMIFPSSTHVPADFTISFYFAFEEYSSIYVCIYTHHIFIIHLSAEGNLGRFNFLTTVNRVEINMAERESVE